MAWSYWRKAIRTGDAVFLVGAGISAEAPSCLPLAAQLSSLLTAPLIAHGTLPRQLCRRIERSLSSLRLEVLGDVLVEHLGLAALAPLTSTLQGAQPNRWHAFLASGIGAGCSVVTTNFDTLAEDACIAASVPYRVVATPREAQRVLSGGSVRQMIVKIHGTLAHIDIPAATKLALALRQVARGLAPAMEALLRALLTDRPLIVAGYAGRDDFDVAPLNHPLI